MTDLRIEFSTGLSASATLYDNPVAATFRQRLPLTLTFHDFNRVEKVATIDPPIPLDGTPDTTAPSPGEIGYYEPTRGVVLYYGHVGRWPGLVRIGTFDLHLETLKGLHDGFTATLAAFDKMPR